MVMIQDTTIRVPLILLDFLGNNSASTLFFPSSGLSVFDNLPPRRTLAGVLALLRAAAFSLFMLRDLTMVGKDLK